MNPKLSVIVPVYNVEDYLDECLSHIINQSYKNMEIILINDGSTDNSEKIIKKYHELDGRIRYIKKENGGLSSARNAGIHIATGDYITFVDSDDFPDTKMYEVLIRLIEKHSVQIAVCSYYRNVKELMQHQDIYDIKMSAEDAFYEIAACGKFEAHAWSKIYKKELFHEVRYPEGRLYEDIFTTYKLIKKSGYLAYTNEKLYFYRLNNSSITNRTYNKNDIDLVYSSEEYLNFLIDNHFYEAAQKQRDSLTRNAIALIKKMFKAKKFYSEQVKYLTNIIRSGYPNYLKSQFKLGSKFFGVGLIILPEYFYYILDSLREDKMIELLKNLLFIMYNLPFSILCWFFATYGKKIDAVFVNCFDGKSLGDNPKSIMKAVYNRDLDVKFYWLDVSGKKAENKIQYIRPNSMKSLYYMSVSKIWISNVRMPFYSYKSIDTTYIHTWHAGIAIKKVEAECPEKLSGRYIMQAKHDSKMIDYIISECDDNTYLYENYFWLDKVNILKIGAPRNDIFFGENEDLKREIRHKFSIQGKKVVLYAPTFRNSTDTALYNLDFNLILKSFHKKFGGEWIAMIRLHPRYMNKLNLGSNDLCIDVTGYPDIQELLVLADILITDYSSISMDFVLTRRPVFIYFKDFEQYKIERGFHIDLMHTPFLIAENDMQLEKNIMEFDYNKYKKEVDIFLKRFGYYDDGHASVKVAELICRKLRKGDHI